MRAHSGDLRDIVGEEEPPEVKEVGLGHALGHLDFELVHLEDHVPDDHAELAVETAAPNSNIDKLQWEAST